MQCLPAQSIGRPRQSCPLFGAVKRTKHSVRSVESASRRVKPAIGFFGLQRMSCKVVGAGKGDVGVLTDAPVHGS